MKLNILLHTSQYRGDHTADVCRAIGVSEYETVADLARRLLKPGEHYDWIEIRAVSEELPAVLGEEAAGGADVRR